MSLNTLKHQSVVMGHIANDMMKLNEELDMGGKDIIGCDNIEVSKINGVLVGDLGSAGKSAYDLYVETTDDSPVKTMEEWLESLKGDSGTNGIDGQNGKSNYELYVDAGGLLTYAEWAETQKGQDGVDGTNGENGLSLLFQGSVLLVAHLPPQPQPINYAWVVQTGEGGLEDDIVYVSNGSTYINIGSIKGADGVDGTNGTDGTTLSAEQLASVNSIPTESQKIATLQTQMTAEQAKLHITQAERDAIVVNSSKVGISPEQTSAIVQNSLKVGVSTALVTQINGNSTNIASVQTTLSAEQGFIDTLQGEMTAVQGDVTTLQTTMTAEQAFIDTLQSDMTAVQGNVTTLQNTMTAEQAFIDTLQSDMTSVQGNVTTLQNTMTAEQAFIDTLQSEMTAEQAKLSITQAERDAIVLNSAKISFDNASSTALTGAVNNISTNTTAIALNTAKLGVRRPCVKWEYTSSGTSAGGIQVASGWVKRVLNAGDTDGTEDFTLSSGVMTCANAGRYYVNFSSVGKGVGRFIVKLRKTTGGQETDEIISLVADAPNSGNHQTTAEGYGIIVAALNDTYELQIKVTNDNVNDGLGADAGFGVNNFHSFVSFVLCDTA